MSYGCSVFQKQRKLYLPLTERASDINLNDRIIGHNLSKENFFLEKAEIQLVLGEETQKFLASLKFEFPDKFLISLKSISGIEALRIYLSGDTILINDRINKKLFAGNSKYLEKKFGIPNALFPLLFGDWLTSKKEDNLNLKCTEGKVETSDGLKGVLFRYVIDCNLEKVLLTELQGSFNQENFKISFNKFIKRGNILIPGSIKVENLHQKIKMVIKMVKIQSPWEGKIEFIPGNRYELVQLL